MVLYKYTNHYGVEILRNLELKITPFNQLNDPFEVTPFVRTLSESGARQELKRPEAFDAAKSDGFKGDQTEWEQHVDQLSSGEMRAVIQAIGKIPSRIIHDSSMKFGLLCLSKRPAHILMWSHYGDAHRGMVIGIDTDLLPEGAEFFEVNYPENNERVEYHSFRRQGDPDYDKFLHELPRTKGFDWKYEEEWRWLYSLNHQNVTLRPFSSGKVGYFLSIPPAAIAEIILGYRCPVGTEAAVKHLIKRNGLTLKLQRGDIHQTSKFEIKFTDVDLD